MFEYVLILDRWPELVAGLLAVGRASRCQPSPAPSDLRDAGALVLRGPEATARLRALRIAGYSLGAVLVGAEADDASRAALEPVVLLGPDAAVAAVAQGLERAEAAQRQQLLDLGPVRVDLGRRIAQTSEGEQLLSQREADLIAYLARRRGRDVTREELLVQVWGHARAGETRAVDMAVLRLRKKLQPDASAPPVILSSRGDGYRLAVTAAPTPPPEPARRGNLERPVGAFLGRGALTASLLGVLRGGERVVALVGPPGVGKSRLAREVGLRALEQGLYPGVWLVTLAGARDLDALGLLAAAALGQTTGEQPTARQALDALAEALARLGPALLILDGAEHLTAEVALAVASWTARAAELTILVTTQVRLGLPDERTIAVPVLEAEDAALLFLDRAARAGAPPPHPEDQGRVAEIARTLDHLPLALELAASRSRTLSPAELLARLRRGGGLAGAAGAAGRHATLEAALGWAWDLCTAAERHALSALTVFEGGFSREAGEVVLGADGERLLDGLLDRSLLLRLPDRPGQPARLDMLKSVAVFARARLDVGAQATAQARQAGWCAALARRLLPQIETEDEAAAIETLAVEAANLAAALARPAPPPAADRVVLALALAELHGVHGSAALQDELLAVAVAAAAGQPTLQAQALLAQARVGVMRGRQVQADLDAALALIADQPPCSLRAQIYACQAELHRATARFPERTEAHQRAQAEAEAAGDAPLALTHACLVITSRFWRSDWLAEVPPLLPMLRQRSAQLLADGYCQRSWLVQAGILAFLDASGQYPEGLRLRQEAVADARRLRNHTWVGGLRMQLGMGLLRAQAFEDAAQELEAVLALARISGSESRAAYARYYGSLALLHLRRFDAAREHLARLEEYGRTPGRERWGRGAGEVRVEIAVDEGLGDLALALLQDQYGEAPVGSAYADKTLGSLGLWCMAYGLSGRWADADAVWRAIASPHMSPEMRLAIQFWGCAVARATGQPEAERERRVGLLRMIGSVDLLDLAAWRDLLALLDAGQASDARGVADGRIRLRDRPSSHYLRLAARAVAAGLAAAPG